MMAILLGILVNNLFKLPEALRPGIKFAVVRILRLGIVLLGIRLSHRRGRRASASRRCRSILGTIVSAIAIVDLRQPARRPHRPARHADRRRHQHLRRHGDRRDVARPSARRTTRPAYAVACITLFGVVAMLAYPFAAHWLFAGDSFKSRHVPRHRGARDGAGGRRRTRLPGVLQRPAGARRRHGHQAGAQPEHAAGDPADGGALPPPLERGRHGAEVVHDGPAVHRRLRGDEPAAHHRRPGRAAVRRARPRPVEVVRRLHQAGRDLLPRHRDGGGRPRHEHQGTARASASSRWRSGCSPPCWSAWSALRWYRCSTERRRSGRGRCAPLP